MRRLRKYLLTSLYIIYLQTDTTIDYNGLLKHQITKNARDKTFYLLYIDPFFIINIGNS